MQTEGIAVRRRAAVFALCGTQVDTIDSRVQVRRAGLQSRDVELEDARVLAVDPDLVARRSSASAVFAIIRARRGSVNRAKWESETLNTRWDPARRARLDVLDHVRVDASVVVGLGSCRGRMSVQSASVILLGSAGAVRVRGLHMQSWWGAADCGRRRRAGLSVPGVSLPNALGVGAQFPCRPRRGASPHRAG